MWNFSLIVYFELLSINWCYLFKQCENEETQNVLYKSCVLAIQRIMCASQAAKVTKVYDMFW